jgi:hypothetical protein
MQLWQMLEAQDKIAQMEYEHKSRLLSANPALYKEIYPEDFKPSVEMSRFGEDIDDEQIVAILKSVLPDAPK